LRQAKYPAREVNAMRSFLAACIAAIVIAVGAFYVMQIYSEPSAALYSTNAVRLDPAKQKN
jgi:ABC-type uncharacterized transport system permease subunit